MDCLKYACIPNMHKYEYLKYFSWIVGVYRRTLFLFVIWCVFMYVVGVFLYAHTYYYISGVYFQK